MGLSIATTAPSSMHGSIVPIAYVTGNGSSNGITFSNIPQIYQDLYLVVKGGNSTSGSDNPILVTFNGTYPNPLSWTYLSGNGSSASSGRTTSSDRITINGTGANSATSTIPATYIAHFLNYANTSTYKTILCRSAEDANGSGQTAITVGLLRSTSAIVGFNVSQNSGNPTPTTSTFALYGVRTVGQ
jgi:hypothetical protein